MLSSLDNSNYVSFQARKNGTTSKFGANPNLLSSLQPLPTMQQDSSSIYTSAFNLGLKNSSQGASPQVLHGQAGPYRHPSLPRNLHSHHLITEPIDKRTSPNRPKKPGPGADHLQTIPTPKRHVSQYHNQEYTDGKLAAVKTPLAGPSDNVMESLEEHYGSVAKSKVVSAIG